MKPRPKEGESRNNWEDDALEASSLTSFQHTWEKWKQMMAERKDSTVRRKREVTPAHFFSTNEEKTKLNWFLFEFALEFERSIRGDRRLSAELGRKGVNAHQIGDFCVHYSKGMKGQILERVAGRIPNVRIGYEEIEAYFPTLGDALVDRLLTVAAKAWDSQTASCEVCPTRCITERDQIASMFGDPFYWG